MEGFPPALTVLVDPLLQGLDGHSARAAPLVGEGLLGQLLQKRAQLSPPQAAAEHFAQDSMTKQGFLAAFFLIHVLLLKGDDPGS